jgi:ribosomal protein L7/L12
MFGNGNDASDIFVYNVFLMKIASESKRQRAKELISKIRGVSMLEAEEIMDRAIVPIVKGVTKKEAEQIQEMFRSDRIAVQVLKKPK